MQLMIRAAAVAFALIWISGCATNMQSRVKGTQRSVYTPDLQTMLAMNHTLVTDRAVLKYVNGILSRLNKALPKPCHCQVLVDGSSGYEAYTLSSHTIILSAGLLAQAGSEDEIAAVIGHELSHATHGDHEKADLESGLMTLARMGAMASGSSAAAANVMYGDAAKNIAKGVIFNHWSAEEEIEADAFSVKLLGKAGYSLEGMKMAVRRLNKYSSEAIATKRPNENCITQSQTKTDYNINLGACASKISGANNSIYLSGKKRLTKVMEEIWKLPPSQRRNYHLTPVRHFKSVNYLYSMNALVADNPKTLRRALVKIERKKIPSSLKRNVNVYNRLAMANFILGNDRLGSEYIMKSFDCNYRTVATFRYLMAFADRKKDSDLVAKILSAADQDLGWSSKLLPEEAYLAKRYDLQIYEIETTARCAGDLARDRQIYNRCATFTKKANTYSGLDWSKVL